MNGRCCSLSISRSKDLKCGHAGNQNDLSWAWMEFLGPKLMSPEVGYVERLNNLLEAIQAFQVRRKMGISSEL